jgi:hypothetical protein
MREALIHREWCAWLLLLLLLGLLLLLVLQQTFTSD